MTKNHKKRYSSVSRDTTREADTREFQDQIMMNNKSEEVLIHVGTAAHNLHTVKNNATKSGTLVLGSVRNSETPADTVLVQNLIDKQK